MRLALLRTALFSLIILSPYISAEWHTDTQGIMGTQVSITFWHTDSAQAAALINAGMAEMRRLDQSLSPWIESSELARVNRLAATSPQKISPELLGLVDKSLYFSKVSKGAFDISFASVGWYYDYRENKQPSDKKREALLPAINYRWLDLNKEKSTLAFKHENVRIDLGGIAKGYAVDRVAKILQDGGVKHATVSAGGDSRVLGDKRGRPWMIGIKNPRDGGEENARPAIMLPLENTAISTSGDYERYFIDSTSGKRIHHILNPKTGKSVEGIVSVTVLGPTGSDTDPMSTTVFVLGVEKGLALVNRIAGFDAIIIDSAGKVHYSEGLAPPETKR
ncbi:thiamine biosynthesis lipoprotein [Alteromonadaceae bacterium Bs31]|nr:thiamine biosynthesis lipoprotein [Alteromonadaceae bacterium Bs31]